MTIGTLGGSPNFLCYQNRPHVTSSLLAKSNINFVIKVMEERCGKCGILNKGSQLNTYPWFVAIRNTDWPDREFFTGTLVSKEWVVTSASAFGFPIYMEKWHALVGETQHWLPDAPWIGISDMRAHPKYTVNKLWTTEISYQYDIAMVKLKKRILDPDPHPADVFVDTIRPICLPDYTSYGESDVPIRTGSYLYNKLALNSRSLNTKEAKIRSYQQCRYEVHNIISDFGMDP